MKKILCILICIMVLFCSCSKDEKKDSEIIIGSVNGVDMNLEDYKEVLSDALNYVYSTYSDGKITQDEFFEKGKAEGKNAFAFAKEYALDKLINIEIAVQIANNYGIVYSSLGNDDVNSGSKLSNIQKKILAQDELFSIMTNGTASPCYVSDEAVESYKKENSKDYEGDKINYIIYRELFVRKKSDKGEKYSYERIRQNRMAINEAYLELKKGEEFKDVWEKYCEDKENSFESFEGDRLYIDSSYGTKAEMIKKLKDGEYSQIYEQSDRLSIFWREKTVMKTEEEINESVRKLLEEVKFSELIKKQKNDAKIKKKDKVIEKLEY